MDTEQSFKKLDGKLFLKNDYKANLANSSAPMHLIDAIIFDPICNYHLLSAHYRQVTSIKVLFYIHTNPWH